MLKNLAHNFSSFAFAGPIHAFAPSTSPVGGCTLAFIPREIARSRAIARVDARRTSRACLDGDAPLRDAGREFFDDARVCDDAERCE
jgi:hypothetical protein